MKRSLVLACVILYSLGVAKAFADSDAAKNSNSDQRVIPVLVSVDKTGKVTDVKPAYDLRPGFATRLDATVRAMVKKPAMKDGHPVPSQFVLNLALAVEPNGSGAYETHFKYVSSKALPVGSWYWVHDKVHHRLALADGTSSFNDALMQKDITPPPLPGQVPSYAMPPSPPHGH